MILVLCPLKIEFKNLKEAFINLNFNITTKPSHCFVNNTPLALAVGGHGKVNFALKTFELIKNLKPKLIICAGAAGGLENIQPLELIAALKTVEHDYKNAFGEKKDLPEFPGDKKTIEQLSLKNIKIGIIASGDEDIVTSKRAKEITSLTGAQAVAWEGAGGAKACFKTQTPFLELRFISDMCNEETTSDFQKNLKEGMNQIAQALLNISV